MRRFWRVALSGTIAVVGLMLPFSANAQFPGTNGRIFYVVLSGSQYQAASANPDGSIPTTIVAPSALSLAVNKNGSKLALDVFNGTSPNGIAIANIDGSGYTQLTSTSNDNAPTWSPDGLTIYFVSTNGIDSVSSTGTGRTNIVANTPSIGYTSPVVSPDGLTLYFIGAPTGGGNNDVFKAAVSGGTVTNLTNNTGSNNAESVDISPDGATLLIENYDSTSSTRTINTMAAAGGSQTTIVTPASGNTISGGKWSPDGTKIVYLLGNGTSNTLYTANANGTSPFNTNLSGVSFFWSVVPIQAAAPTLPKAGGLPQRSTLGITVALSVLTGLCLAGSYEAARRVRGRR